MITDTSHHGRRERRAVAADAHPVMIGTAPGGGAPPGTTGGALASPSRTSSMVVGSLDRAAIPPAPVPEPGRFGVDVLGGTRSVPGVAFARTGPATSDGVPWELDLGVPRPTEAPRWVACEAAQLVAGGVHVVALRTVVDPETSLPETSGGDRRTDHRRVFDTYAALEVVQ